MRPRVRLVLSLTLGCSLVSSCTGLMAGPAQQSSSIAPVGRDSAWVRARRAMASEVFSVEMQDSVRGVLYGVRHPRPGTLAADIFACRLHVTYSLQGDGTETTVERQTQYTVPRGANGRPTVGCDEDLAEVVGRMDTTIMTGR